VVKIIATVLGLISLGIWLYVSGIFSTAMYDATDKIAEQQFKENEQASTAYETAKTADEAVSTYEDARDTYLGINKLLRQVGLPVLIIGGGISGIIVAIKKGMD
jgi:hypothetical protein